MATRWYCRLMGTEMGPFSSKQLLEMARSHKITPDDAVKKGADGNWVDAHRVKGLFEDLSASTIITASLPPDVQRELDKRRAKQRPKRRRRPPPLNRLPSPGTTSPTKAKSGRSPSTS